MEDGLSLPHLYELLEIRRMGMPRAHTSFVVKPYSVAEHSYYLAVLIELYFEEFMVKVLWQPVTEQDKLNLIVKALFHDIAEIKTGDIPAPFKGIVSRVSPDLRECEEEVENQLLKKIYQVSSGKEYIQEPLPGSHKLAFKFFDLLEFLLSRVQEYLMGNKFAMLDGITQNFEWIENLIRKTPYRDRINCLLQWPLYKEIKCSIEKWEKESKETLNC
jgi:5'-deoxynucleotidase YfbR-like HD superfamily hydrolase